jgi:hypothetical protein
MTPSAPATPIRPTRTSPTPTSTHQRESRDSLGIGKLVEGQMRAVIDIIKARKLLKEPPPPPTSDAGIVVSAGGRYADWGLVNAKWMRHHQNIQLPIQVWHLGPKEIPNWMRPHFHSLDIELVDAHQVRTRHWHRKLQGWSLKQYAAMRAPFQVVLSLDADAFITAPPALVLDDPAFQSTGAFFCADVAPCRKSNWAYVHAQVPPPTQEMESGFFAWDRSRPEVWQAIQMTHWIAEHSEVWDRLLHGDKDRPALAFGTLGVPYTFASEPIWMGWGIRHHWKGIPICDHGMGWKRGEHAAPNPVLPHLFEWVRSLH